MIFDLLGYDRRLVTLTVVETNSVLADVDRLVLTLDSRGVEVAISIDERFESLFIHFRASLLDCFCALVQPVILDLLVSQAADLFRSQSESTELNIVGLCSLRGVRPSGRWVLVLHVVMIVRDGGGRPLAFVVDLCMPFAISFDSSLFPDPLVHLNSPNQAVRVLNSGSEIMVVN